MITIDEHLDLAYAVISLADSGGMPDSFFQTDRRIALARRALGMEDDDLDRATLEKLAAKRMSEVWVAE